MNKIIYNLNTYQLIEIDFSQILVVGQENAINIDLYFKNGDVFKVDTDWQVWLTFERPDGESTNITLATLNNDHYSKKIGSWFTAVAGIGKIFTIIKVNGETIAPFAVAKVQIFEGGTPSDDTISQEQYNELLSNINDVNNKLENHINDKNNPHGVTPEQLNVYEKEHVNDIAEQVDENKTDISTLKTDMGAINGLRTDVNKNTNDISNLGGRVSTNENNIVSLGGRLLTAEQEILLRAKTSEVVAMINSHDNDIEAHQYILRLIAAVSAGGVKPLVFDTLEDLETWLESGTIVHQGYTPDMLELGQLLYTIPEDELDYWVSVLPVNELSDLTPLQGMVDLSAYALLTDLDAIMFSLDGVLSSVNILETIKVDKVDGKGLSTNDYTNADKTLVGTILDKVDKVEGKGLSTNDFTDADKLEVGKIANKVDKVTGKGLSTNDYTTTEKNKLAGIASGAEVNVQSDWNAASGDALILNKPTIPTNNNQLTNGAGYITGYTETDPIFTAWNKSTGISITKSQVSDLLEATQSISGLMSATDKARLDVLHALLEEDTANNVVDSINEVLAIFNNYPEGADLVTALAGKVDKVEGKGLSTEDYTSSEKTKLSGIQAGAQVNPTTAQIKTQYESNANTNAFTDTEKTKLGGIQAGAEVNVNADWNASSGDAQILNKPTLATVATSGSYKDLSNKPTVPDTSGLLPKSGGTLENYNEKITTLSTSSGAINLSLSNVFVQTPSANITYAINNSAVGVAHSFTLIVNMGATVRTLTFPANVKWQGGEIPDMTTASKTYVLTFLTVDGGTTWLGMFGGEF